MRFAGRTGGGYKDGMSIVFLLQRNEESLTLFMAVAAMEGITALYRSHAHGIVTIDMCWAVILNGAKRNEESLTSVAASQKILLPTRREKNDKFGLIPLSL